MNLFAPSRSLRVANASSPPTPEKGICSVAVIGGGVSGLVAAKSLIEEGIEPVIFEEGVEIGGIWRYDENATDGSRPAYWSMRANSSKEMMSFSDFEFPKSLPDFPDRASVLEYLNDYADQFRLRERIRFGAKVEKITLNDQAGSWEVVTKDLVRNDIQRQVFDAVAVCTGLYNKPKVPEQYYNGKASSFLGTILHSSAYKRPHKFAGKNVVIVGLGSSGTEIAAELSTVARKVYLSTAKGGWLVPRYVGGKPYDHNLNRLGNFLPYPLRMWFFRRLVLKEYKRIWCVE